MIVIPTGQLQTVAVLMASTQFCNKIKDQQADLICILLGSNTIPTMKPFLPTHRGLCIHKSRNGLTSVSSHRVFVKIKRYTERALCAVLTEVSALDGVVVERDAEVVTCLPQLGNGNAIRAADNPRLVVILPFQQHKETHTHTRM